MHDPYEAMRQFASSSSEERAERPLSAAQANAAASAAAGDTPGAQSRGNAGESISAPRTPSRKQAAELAKEISEVTAPRRYGEVATATISGLTIMLRRALSLLDEMAQQEPWYALCGLKASFIYDREIGCHVAVCSRAKWHDGKVVRCGNGPLEGDELLIGECSSGPHVEVEHEYF